MIKDIVLTLMINENNMAKIYSLKLKFYFIIFTMTNILFPIIFNILLSFIVKKYSSLDYFLISILEIKDNLIFNILMFLILFVIFYSQTNKTEHYGLMLKTVIAMNFIHPVMAIINYYVENIFFEITFILYDIVFAKAFTKKNMPSKDLSTNKQFACIFSTFLILLILYGGIYKIVFLN